MTRSTNRGFSLIETALAAGIAAGALVIVIGLLAGLASRAADARDRRIAAGLPSAIAVTLREISAERGWAALVAEAASEPGVRLVADSFGAQLREPRPAPATPDEDEYFLVIVRRITTGTLAYRVDRPVLPLRVRVEWPFRPKGSADTERERVEFVIVLHHE